MDPRDGRPFYVGKGKGDRVFNHLASARRGGLGLKNDRIRNIYEAGLEPKLDILRLGLDEASAFHVEAAALHVVELMGGSVTNLVQGHGVAFGRMTAEELEVRYNRRPATIDVPAVLIRISQEYHADLTPEQLYERTRRYWKVDLARAARARYAFAVSDGIIRAFYEINRWIPATEDPEPHDPTRLRPDTGSHHKRNAFVGHRAGALASTVGLTVDHIFTPGAETPIKHVNCGTSPSAAIRPDPRRVNDGAHGAASKPSSLPPSTGSTG